MQFHVPTLGKVRLGLCDSKGAALQYAGCKAAYPGEDMKF